MKFKETRHFLIVTLSDEERVEFNILAQARTKEAAARCGSHKYGHASSTEIIKQEAEYVGVASELIVANYMGLPWSGEAFNAPDVGDNVQVRCGMGDYKGLICHPSDNDDHIFVCVTYGDEFRIHGWLPGREAKHPRHWNDKQMWRAPAFLVSQRDLRDYRLLRIKK